MTTRRDTPEGIATPDNDRYYSQAVGRAFEALEYIKRASKPLKLQDLTVKLSGAKASIFRLLYTLEAVGYVVRDASGAYQLSPDIRALVPKQLIGPLVQIAEPVIEGLAREFRETVSLAALFDNHIEVIAVAESPQVIRMSNTVGRIIQPHASSLGKSIAAFQTEQRRDHLLRSYGIYRYTPKTITDGRELSAEFKRIRQRGYAVEREETTLQGCCFGVPILAEDGSAFASVSIAMPIMRLEGEEQEAAFVEELRKAAQTIQKATAEWSPNSDRS